MKVHLKSEWTFWNKVKQLANKKNQKIYFLLLIKITFQLLNISGVEQNLIVLAEIPTSLISKLSWWYSESPLGGVVIFIIRKYFLKSVFYVKKHI